MDNVNQAYDQRLRIDNMTLNVSGNVTVKRGMLYFKRATVNVGGIDQQRGCLERLPPDTGTVTATGGIDISAIASQTELYGGSVTTPFIKVSNPAGHQGLESWATV